MKKFIVCSICVFFAMGAAFGEVNPIEQNVNCCASISCSAVEPLERGCGAGQKCTCNRKGDGTCTQSCVTDLGGGEIINVCIPGKYGNGTNCRSCATDTGNSAATSTSLDNDAITKCFLPTTADFEDDTGTYKYSDKCYYSN